MVAYILFYRDEVDGSKYIFYCIGMRWMVAYIYILLYRDEVDGSLYIFYCIGMRWMGAWMLNWNL